MKFFGENILICPECKGIGYFAGTEFSYKIGEKMYRKKIDSCVCPYCDGARVIREKIYHEKLPHITEDFIANEKEE